MTIRVSVDGVITDAEEARIPVLDRGFLYGDAVFEVFRTYGGVPHELDVHLARLEGSAERLRFRLPVSRAQLAEEVAAAIADAGHPESYVRVVVTRGRGPLGLDPTTAIHPLRVIVVAPLVTPPPAFYEAGVAVITLRSSHEAGRKSTAGAKVANYVENILATVEAKEKGAHEAFFVDGSGQVLEGRRATSSSSRAGVSARRLSRPASSAASPGASSSTWHASSESPPTRSPSPPTISARPRRSSSPAASGRSSPSSASTGWTSGTDAPAPSPDACSWPIGTVSRGPTGRLGRTMVDAAADPR